jgi:HSP20 family protein
MTFSLTPWRSRSEEPFTSLQAAMNNLFEDWNRSILPMPTAMTSGLPALAFSPKVDVSEDEKAIQVVAELPGLEEKDIDVSVTPDALTIRGEKKEEREEKKRNYYRMERSFGAFQRMVPLACEVDREKVTAGFKQGVLTITLPKMTPSPTQVRKVPIR